MVICGNRFLGKRYCKNFKILKRTFLRRVRKCSIVNSNLNNMINTMDVTYNGINVEANSYQIIGHLPDGISHDKILSFSIVWVTRMQGISSIVVEPSSNVYLYASGKISDPLSAIKIRFLYRK